MEAESKSPAAVVRVEAVRQNSEAMADGRCILALVGRTRQINIHGQRPDSVDMHDR